MNEGTDTPETEKLEDYLYEHQPTQYQCEEALLQLCRKLERERDEARRKIAELEDDIRAFAVFPL